MKLDGWLRCFGDGGVFVARVGQRTEVTVLKAGHGDGGGVAAGSSLMNQAGIGFCDVRSWMVLWCCLGCGYGAEGSVVWRRRTTVVRGIRDGFAEYGVVVD
ncbi:hypothetical protein M0R45_019644 [Rubus argutus]|uniref:Uncharacterized protein n=1 Tax=Rubus argutus TaxID=59490 RepID=A0AAW1X6F1_RUBAR